MAGASTQDSTPQALPLDGRVAIVTGASRGIGRAIAVHLASLGANLVVNYVSNSAQAELIASQINSSSSSPSRPRAIVVCGDVSNSTDVKALFDQAEQAFGTQVHILVTSAGVLDSKSPTLANTTEEDWDKISNVNAKGTFLCCREAAKRLVHGGGGRILTVSSAAVASLGPGFAAYTASKAAVEVMTRILAKELKGTSITANCVAPGPTATDMFFSGITNEKDIKMMVDSIPLGRLGETKDVAPLVGFLATDAAEWINGQVIGVNGGYV